MSESTDEKDDRAHPLGRKLLFLENDANLKRIIIGLAIFCALLFIADPILHRHFREMDGLWREMRDADATKDKGAYAALHAEVRRIAEQAKPKLRQFLDARQTRYVMELMSRFRYGGKPTTSAWSGDLRARERDLTERWEALLEEWRVFKEEAYGVGRDGGKGK